MLGLERGLSSVSVIEFWTTGARASPKHYGQLHENSGIAL